MPNMLILYSFSVICTPRQYNERQLALSMGVEPTTHGVRSRYSAIELRKRIFFEHQVSVWEWQFGQSNRRFSNRSSELIPLIWSTCRVKGFPFHSEPTWHSEHRSKTPLAKSASFKGTFWSFEIRRTKIWSKLSSPVSDRYRLLFEEWKKLTCPPRAWPVSNSRLQVKQICFFFSRKVFCLGWSLLECPERWPAYFANESVVNEHLSQLNFTVPQVGFEPTIDGLESPAFDP